MNLDVNNLSVSIGPKKILTEISFSLGPGENLAVLGPSGSGKSTLAKAILGMLEPHSIRGGIFFEKKCLQKDAQILVGLAARGFAYVPQSLALWPHLNVEQCLDLAFIFSNKAGLKKDAILHDLGLEKQKHSMPNELSIGQQQRLALARALVSKPKLLILDEPFANLDLVTKISIMELLKRLSRALGFSMITITHDLGEACFLCQKIMIILNGEKLCWQNSHDFFKNPSSHWPVATAFMKLNHKINEFKNA